MRLAVPKNSPNLQGRHIFAYRNFRTNQIIYSFNRVLKLRDLNAQLPDLGANSRPAEVRLDSWKPLWTITFPENAAGYYQGLAAFQALRKWKEKREIAHQVTPELPQQRTEEQIEEVWDYLERRGGSKKEKPWDLFRRQNKALRKRVIKDQKATSIADLAYVLQLQHSTGKKRDTHRRHTLRPAELKALWDNGHNYQKKADAVVVQLRTAQQELQTIYTNHPNRIINTAPVLELRAQVKRLKAKLKTIVFAANVVRQVKADYAKEHGHAISELSPITEETYLRQASWKSQDADVEKIQDPLDAVPEDGFDRVVIEERLPTFIGTGQEVPMELWASASAGQRELMKKQWSPSMTAQGIEIRWEDPLDAEYAEEWPAGVIHRPMGVVKHIANDPKMPPLLTAEDWTERRRVERDLRRLERIEAQSSADETRPIRAPIMVRRTEEGLVEHVFREQREELGLEEPKEKREKDAAEAAPREAKPRPTDEEVASAFRKHAAELEHGKVRKPVVITIPLHKAPTATSARV